MTHGERNMVLEEAAVIAEHAYVREKKYRFWGAFWTIDTRPASGKEAAEAIRSAKQTFTP